MKILSAKKVTKVQIRQSENDIGAVYPDTEITENDNSYILQDNFLVYGMSADALETIARNLYEVIKVVKYRPYNCEKNRKSLFEPWRKQSMYIRLKKS